MPKKSEARKIGTSQYGEGENKVAVDLFELNAKTKDSDGKETKFSYTFPKFADTTPIADVVKSLTYTNSKKETISGESVILDYVNTALKNAARSAKLAEITGVLKLREDPEAAIKSMVDAMVVGFGVAREVADANVRAMIASGSIKVPGLETPATT